MCFSSEQPVRRHEADVLVLGSGAAGCGAALAAEEAGASVLLLDKGRLESSGCLGGGNDHFLAVLESGEPHDTIEDLIGEYATPSSGTSAALVASWGRAMRPMLELLESLGVEFLHRPDGSYLRTGGFGEPGAWYVNIARGYRTKRLLAGEIRRRGVRVLDHVMVLRLLKREGRVIGAVAYNVLDGVLHIIRARAVVLALGNFANRAVPNSTGNPFNTWHSPFNTGAQYILAYRAGARLLNLDLRQHATLIPKGFGCAGMNGIMDTGAHELNAEGRRFLTGYHPLGERCPRHFQIRGTDAERVKGRAPFFMDLRHADKEALRHLNETLMPGDKATWPDWTAQTGLDLRRDLMEVEFSEIEFGGLVEVDDCFATRVPGLYNACVFYSFSGALCGGYAAGENAARGMADEMPGWPDEDFEQERERILHPLHVRRGIPQQEFEAAIRQVMSCYMGMVRNERGMKIALEKLDFIGASAFRVMAEGMHDLMLAHESMFLLESSKLAVAATIERRETGRSIYRRSDYPELNPAMNRPLAIWNNGGTPCTAWI